MMRHLALLISLALTACSSNPSAPSKGASMPPAFTSVKVSIQNLPDTTWYIQYGAYKDGPGHWTSFHNASFKLSQYNATWTLPITTTLDTDFSYRGAGLEVRFATEKMMVDNLLLHFSQSRHPFTETYTLRLADVPFSITDSLLTIRLAGVQMSSTLLQLAHEHVEDHGVGVDIQDDIYGGVFSDSTVVLLELR